MSPEEKVAKFLIKTRKTLSVAESCTGGLIASRLTNIPGSSRFFKLGVIAYANEAKVKLLKVPRHMLHNYGAVSPRVARWMAKGIRNLARTDFGVGITGIAGPTGGTKQKPVGLTYIAFSASGKDASLKFIFKGARLSIKSQAATKTLQHFLNFMS